jgi:hypothetical protein
MTKKRPLFVRLIVGFGRFWWDFLVGDTPELFLATVITLLVTAILSVVAQLNALSIVVLPLLVTLSLSASVARAVKSAQAKNG